VLAQLVLGEGEEEQISGNQIGTNTGVELPPLITISPSNFRVA
jgi:hypothetical protein